jgi:hypothetical protein
MSLSRERAEQEFGLAFIHEGVAHPADPDQVIFEADITLDGHTESLQGKSEEDILASAERLLLSRGKIEREDPIVEAEPLPTQSADVGDPEVPDDEDVFAGSGEGLREFIESNVGESSGPLTAEQLDQDLGGGGQPASDEPAQAEAEAAVAAEEGASNDASTEQSDVHDGRDSGDNPTAPADAEKIEP